MHAPEVVAGGHQSGEPVCVPEPEAVAPLPLPVEVVVRRGAAHRGVVHAPSVRGEVEAHQTLGDDLRLHGFIDRLEKDGYGNHGIVDYKTGVAPSVDEVLDGEKVQATHYALLEDSCTSVEYLVVKRGQKSPKPIQGDELLEAAERVRKRLVDVFAALRKNAPLPAHGDTKTCELCEYRGLCRVDTWAEESA